MHWYWYSSCTPHSHLSWKERLLLQLPFSRTTCDLAVSHSLSSLHLQVLGWQQHGLYSHLIVLERLELET
jgi:hypothetical protein